MTMTRLKLAAAVLAAGIVATGAAATAYQDAAKGAPAGPPGAAPREVGAAETIADAPKGKAPGDPALAGAAEDAAAGEFGAGGDFADSGPGGFATEIGDLAREAARLERQGDIDGALDAIRRLEGRAREWDRALRVGRPGRPGAGMRPMGLPGAGPSNARPATKPAAVTTGEKPAVGSSRVYTMDSGSGANRGMKPGAAPQADNDRGDGKRPGHAADQERRIRELERKLDEVLKALKDQRQNDRPSDRPPGGP
jgi:hypothetical protein